MMGISFLAGVQLIIVTIAPELLSVFVPCGLAIYALLQRRLQERSRPAATRSNGEATGEHSRSGSAAVDPTAAAEEAAWVECVALISETLGGAVTVRAFSAAGACAEELDHRLAKHAALGIERHRRAAATLLVCDAIGVFCYVAVAGVAVMKRADLSPGVAG
jgi:hypothetical protein